MDQTEDPKPVEHLTRPGSLAQRLLREFCRQTGRKIQPTQDRAILLGLELMKQREAAQAP